MENEFGLQNQVVAAELAVAFSGNWPKIVFLSGCRTGLTPQKGVLPSLAELMVEAGVTTVLGWAQHRLVTMLRPGQRQKFINTWLTARG